MRTLLFILLFSISLTAQEKKENNARQNVFTTTIDGKSSADGSLEMTRDELFKSAIGLKAKNDGQALPKIMALEVFIPGYPAIQIKGDKLDEETKAKINKLEDGNVIVIKGIVARTVADESLDHYIVRTTILLKS